MRSTSECQARPPLHLANPDLVERFAAGETAFNKPDPATFYGAGPEGYTDYPAMAEAAS